MSKLFKWLGQWLGLGHWWWWVQRWLERWCSRGGHVTDGRPSNQHCWRDSVLCQRELEWRHHGVWLFSRFCPLGRSGMTYRSVSFKHIVQSGWGLRVRRLEHWAWRVSYEWGIQLHERPMEWSGMCVLCWFCFGIIKNNSLYFSIINFLFFYPRFSSIKRQRQSLREADINSNLYQWSVECWQPTVWLLRWLPPVG